jgi:drug/metabolite transporter (DMT)-like permease
MTVLGIWFWEPMSGTDWAWMALLCATGAFGHWLLIKCYEIAEAGSVQPFAYFQLVFVSVIGVTLFSETLRFNVVVGAIIVVAAGLFTLWREHRAAQRVSP